MATSRSTLVPSASRQGKFFSLFLTPVLLLVLFPYLDKPGLPTILFRLLSAVAFLGPCVRSGSPARHGRSR